MDTFVNNSDISESKIIVINYCLACCTNGKIRHAVMLNLFSAPADSLEENSISKHLYETLKRVQGDKNRFAQRDL